MRLARKTLEMSLNAENFTCSENLRRAPPGGPPHFRSGKGVGGDGGIGGEGDVHWRQSSAKANALPRVVFLSNKFNIVLSGNRIL